MGHSAAWPSRACRDRKSNCVEVPVGPRDCGLDRGPRSAVSATWSAAGDHRPTGATGETRPTVRYRSTSVPACEARATASRRSATVPIRSGNPATGRSETEGWRSPTEYTHLNQRLGCESRSAPGFRNCAIDQAGVREDRRTEKAVRRGENRRSRLRSGGEDPGSTGLRREVSTSETKSGEFPPLIPRPATGSVASMPH